MARKRNITIKRILAMRQLIGWLYLSIGQIKPAASQQSRCFCYYENQTKSESEYCLKNPVKKERGFLLECDESLIYPITISNLLVSEAGNKIFGSAKLEAQDNLLLSINDLGGNTFLIDTSRIVEWISISASTKEFNQTGAVYGALIGGVLLGLPGLVGGAAIGGGPTYTYSEGVSLRYRLPDESETSMAIYAPNIYDNLRVVNLIRNGTGMNSGIRRSEVNFQNQRLKRQKLFSDQLENLSIGNKNKPWCKSPPTDPSSLAQYNLIAGLLSANNSSTKPQVSSSNTAAWSSYLSSNPPMASWAKANPAAASKVEKCNH